MHICEFVAISIYFLLYIYRQDAQGYDLSNNTSCSAIASGNSIVFGAPSSRYIVSIIIVYIRRVWLNLGDTTIRI